MASQIKKEFIKNGIVKFDKILTNQEINSIRRSIEKKFISDGKKYIQFDELDDFPKLLDLIFKKEKFIKSILEVYKNPIFYPDFIIQVENYSTDLIPHQDLQSFHRFGDRACLKKVQYSKIGLYLQNSSEDNPTSIFAAEGSHNFMLTKISQSIPFFGYKLLKFFKNFVFLKYKKLMQVNAGDMLFFDGQVLHSSVMSKKKINSEIKIAIYFSCVNGNQSLYPLIKNEFLKYHTELIEKNQIINKHFAHQRSYILSNPFKSLNFKKIKRMKKENFFIFH